MFAIKLVQLIEAHADSLSEGLTRKLKSSERCQELFLKVPSDELQRRTHEIYRNLSDWLQTKTESEIEERYVGLGIRRARQGVAFSDFLWAINTTREYLWEFLQRQGLLEEPVEFFGELELFHSLERFFDRVLYFAAVGYESVPHAASEHTSRIHAVGQW